MNKSKVEVKNMTYSLSEIKANYDKKEFRIPKYQRGYVWDSGKRASLIDSVLRGYPIGSIIIWKSKGLNYVLDGQQRTRSLIMIREHPFKDISQETFNSLFNDDVVNAEENMLEKILKNLRSKTIEELYVEQYDTKKQDYIVEYLNKIKSQAEINGIDTDDVVTSLKQYVSRLYLGSEFNIPSIDIIDSSEEDAIEIFDRLNSNGIELTRMEKLAARWSNNIININDKNLLAIIKNIYNVDNSEDIRDMRENTPAEIVWAILTKSFENTTFFKKLFTEEKNGIISLKHQHLDKLLWIIRVMVLKYHGLSFEENLSDDFERDTELGTHISEMAKKSEISLLKSIETLNVVWKTLEQRMPILMKKTNDNYIFINAASTNLFVSMASQLFGELLTNPEYEVNSYLQLTLIREILKGSYESSTNRVVKESIINSEYMQVVTIEDVNKKLNEINNLQKEEINSKNGFRNIAKLVISIAYSEYSNNKIDKYDFDHVVPRNYLRNLDLSRGQNSIGNCGLLEYTTNREKQDKYNVDELLSDKLVKLEKFDTESYLKLLNKFKASPSRENFNEIMDYRYELISERFIKNINPINK